MCIHQLVTSENQQWQSVVLNNGNKTASTIKQTINGRFKVRYNSAFLSRSGKRTNGKLYTHTPTHTHTHTHRPDPLKKNPHWTWPRASTTLNLTKQTNTHTHTHACKHARTASDTQHLLHSYSWTLLLHTKQFQKSHNNVSSCRPKKTAFDGEMMSSLISHQPGLAKGGRRNRPPDAEVNSSSRRFTIP